MGGAFNKSDKRGTVKQRETSSGLNRVGNVVDGIKFRNRFETATKGAKNTKIAQEIEGYTDGSIGKILNGRQDLSIDFLVKIARRYNCSIDYLLGLSDDVSITGRSPEHSENTGVEGKETRLYSPNLKPSAGAMLSLIDRLVEEGVIDIISLNDFKNGKGFDYSDGFSTEKDAARCSYGDGTKKRYCDTAIALFDIGTPLSQYLRKYSEIREVIDKNILPSSITDNWNIVSSWVHDLEKKDFYVGFWMDESIQYSKDGTVFYSYIPNMGSEDCVFGPDKGVIRDKQDIIYEYDEKSDDWIKLKRVTKDGTTLFQDVDAYIGGYYVSESDSEKIYVWDDSAQDYIIPVRPSNDYLNHLDGIDEILPFS